MAQSERNSRGVWAGVWAATYSKHLFVFWVGVSSIKRRVAVMEHTEREMTLGWKKIEVAQCLI